MLSTRQNITRCYRCYEAFTVSFNDRSWVGNVGTFSALTETEMRFHCGRRYCDIEMVMFLSKKNNNENKSKHS